MNHNLARSLSDFSSTYLTDPRDQVLLANNPTLMMPRFGALPSLEIGMKRFVLARDGLYIQARSHVLTVTAKLADTPPMPYGGLEPSVEMIGGLLPAALYHAFCASALSTSPVETAGFVLWDRSRKEYVLAHREGITSSTTHISYLIDDIDDDMVVCNWHSHGKSPAFFSKTDDASDNRGLYIASVFGHCTSPADITVTTRIVIDGYYIPIPWHPWEILNSPTTVSHCASNGFS